MRHADLTGQPFDRAALDLGLTEKQTGVLKREYPGPQTAGSVPLPPELERRIVEGLWIEDKDAPRTDPKERVFRRRCRKCGQWAMIVTSGHEPIVAGCMSTQCWIDAGTPD